MRVAFVKSLRMIHVLVFAEPPPRPRNWQWPLGRKHYIGVTTKTDLFNKTHLHSSEKKNTPQLFNKTQLMTALFVKSLCRKFLRVSKALKTMRRFKHQGVASSHQLEPWRRPSLSLSNWGHPNTSPTHGASLGCRVDLNIIYLRVMLCRKKNCALCPFTFVLYNFYFDTM